ncbi:MAG: hypothetical protein Kow0032_21540 [Methyloligellaceae bacterium]
MGAARPGREEQEMTQRRTNRAKAIAAREDARNRAIRISAALLITGLLASQLLLLISP